MRLLGNRSWSVIILLWIAQCLGHTLSAQERTETYFWIDLDGPLQPDQVKLAHEVLVGLDPLALVSFANDGAMAKCRSVSVSDPLEVRNALNMVGFQVNVTVVGEATPLQYVKGASGPSGSGPTVIPDQRTQDP